ncbi:MAG: ABC transporter ATP-binding protein [Desulfobacteraceae bacterium]|nr:ABC transporter ATP-binding protein [Desulfobacteraceae bacterium]
MKKNPVLSTQNLYVGYGKKQVVKEINLEFFPGEFVSLLGPNGAGKTTLLRTLSRHLPPLEGSITLNGQNLSWIKSSDLAKIMSVVLTQKVAPPLLQVYDFVAMGRYPHTSWTGNLNKEDDIVVLQALNLVHAQDLMFRDISTLSDGERQKVLIARALAQEPNIILLDEPTMHLDLKHRMEVMSILHDLCREKGICVVASLHDIEVAAKVSDRVALIKDDAIIAFGTPEDILMDDTVSKLYDFSNASFNRLLGNIEIKTKADKAKVFVIGGMGSASVLYRLLSKKGYEVATGVLLKNDIDYFVAKALGIQCLVQDTLDVISMESVEQASKIMEQCDFVIDAGFEAAGLNMANLELLAKAITLKKTVFCMNSCEERKTFNYQDISKIKFSKTESNLVAALEERQEKEIA